MKLTTEKVRVNAKGRLAPKETRVGGEKGVDDWLEIKESRQWVGAKRGPSERCTLYDGNLDIGRLTSTLASCGALIVCETLFD